MVSSCSFRCGNYLGLQTALSEKSIALRKLHETRPCAQIFAFCRRAGGARGKTRAKRGKRLSCLIFRVTVRTREARWLFSLKETCGNLHFMAVCYTWRLCIMIGLVSICVLCSLKRDNAERIPDTPRPAGGFGSRVGLVLPSVWIINHYQYP